MENQFVSVLFRFVDPIFHILELHFSLVFFAFLRISFFTVRNSGRMSKDLGKWVLGLQKAERESWLTSALDTRASF